MMRTSPSVIAIDHNTNNDIEHRFNSCSTKIKKAIIEVSVYRLLVLLSIQ